MSQSEPRRCHTASSNWLKIMRNQESLSLGSALCGVDRHHAAREFHGGQTSARQISRAGDESLRRLLVLGATAVIQQAKTGRASPWLLGLLARKPKKLAAVALANKMARIVWAMMVSGETYRRPTVA